MKFKKYLEEGIKVWLDDEREEPVGWKRFKNVPDLINFYKNNYKKIDELSLDHDLGKNEQDGYKFLEWLEREVVSGKYKEIPKIKVHSANPVGRKRMEQAIDSIKRKKE